MNSKSVYICSFSSPGKQRQYHVQFFGDEGERGWMTEGAMLPYEGRQQFEVWRKEKLNKAKGRDRQRYQVTDRRRTAWEIGVASAEYAFQLTLSERRAQCTFQYVLPPDKKTEAAAAAAAAEAEAEAPSTTGGKKRKLSQGVEPDTPIQPKKKRRRRSKLSDSTAGTSNTMTDQSAAQYYVFCQKRRDQVRRQHPAYTEKQLEKQLKQQWEALSDDDKAKFIPMGADVKHLRDDELDSSQSGEWSMAREMLG